MVQTFLMSIQNSLFHKFYLLLQTSLFYSLWVYNFNFQMDLLPIINLPSTFPLNPSLVQSICQPSLLTTVNSSLNPAEFNIILRLQCYLLGGQHFVIHKFSNNLFDLFSPRKLRPSHLTQIFHSK